MTVQEMNVEGNLVVNGEIINESIEKYDAGCKFYYNLSDIGLDDSCTLSELTTAMPTHSKLSIWLTNNTNIRNEIINELNLSSGEYGIFEIERHNSSTYTLTFKSYNKPSAYTKRYSTNNSAGYSLCTKPLDEVRIHSTSDSFGSNYQMVIDNWGNLPNGSFSVAISSVKPPFTGVAFGYRNGDYGHFIYMDYGNVCYSVNKSGTDVSVKNLRG